MPELSFVVVDEDAACRLVISEVLADAGFSPVAAAASVEELGTPGDGAVQLVIVDVSIDGLDAISALRRWWPKARVLAMTGGWKVLDAGAAEAVIYKPFTAEKLMAAVQAALAAKR